ncbi:MAG TPA: hypothetical protein VMZ69_05345, partial [Saprospiraceae bacterium]|nr:hypothetical protein [Saprospiraceae bacterium]
MHTRTFSILLFLSITQSHSMIAQSLNGEYRLTGIPETASAFRFTRDGHFDFFFIYGAVDRSASGTYTTDGKTIKLASEKVAGKDFPITKESKKGNHYTIQVNDANSYLVRNIICIYHIGEEKNVAYSDNNGQITIDAPHVDTIYLLHELFPDVPSLIKDEKNTNN